VVLKVVREGKVAEVTVSQKSTMVQLLIAIRPLFSDVSQLVAEARTTETHLLVVEHLA